MSFFTIFALILLPILGGVIAYFGDVIGYRLGKSRRSVFGLRPRSTARLIAIVVGVLLPLTTMIVAAVGSQTVKTALFRLTQLQESNAQLEADNANLTTRIEASRRQRETAQAAAAEAQAQVEQARIALRAARGDLSGAQAALSQARGQLATAKAELGRLAAQVRGLEESRKSLQTDLETNRESLRLTQEQLRDSQIRLREAKAKEDAALESLAQADEKVQVLQAKEQELAEKVRMAGVNLGQAQERLASAESTLKKANEELTRRQGEVEKANEQIESLKELYLQQLGISGGAPVLYEPGTELRRAILDSYGSLAQTEADLEELVVLANKQVRAAMAAAGAALPPEDQPAVVLIGPAPAREGQGAPDQAVVIRTAAQVIQRRQEATYVASVVVYVRSFVAEERPVLAALSIRPNALIYPEGTVVVRREIDGARPRVEVFSQLWGLVGDLRRAAHDAGLMPDRETGLYGQVQAEAILKTLDDLMARKQRVEVQALAAQDVHVAEEKPFSVTLKVVEPGRGNGGD